MDAIQFGSIDHRGQGSVGVCAPFGAETADDLAMNDRRTQSPFADIVGRRDIAAVQEDEQTLAMFLVAALQSTGIRVGQGLKYRHPFCDRKTGKRSHPDTAEMACGLVVLETQEAAPI